MTRFMFSTSDVEFLKDGADDRRFFPIVMGKRRMAEQLYMFGDLETQVIARAWPETTAQRLARAEAARRRVVAWGGR